MSLEKYKDIRDWTAIKKKSNDIAVPLNLDKNQAFSIRLLAAYGLIYSSEEEIHKIFTPISLIKEITDKFVNNTLNYLDKTYLVIYTVEWAVYLNTVLNVPINQITIVTDSKERKDFCDHFGYKRISEKKFFEGVDVKFDIIVGNPPYNRNIHLEFLSRAYDMCNKYVLFIRPSTWLTIQKPGNLFKWREELHQKIGKEFDEFDLINGNAIFGIGLFAPCVITKIIKNKKSIGVKVTNKMTGDIVLYDDITQINPLFCDAKLFEVIKNKIWLPAEKHNVDQEILKSFDERKDAPYHIHIPNIGGRVNMDGSENKFVKDDFYQFVYESKRNVQLERHNASSGNATEPNLSFYLKNEAENCLDYLINSRIAKFALMLVKSGRDLHVGELRYVPFFDFSEKWDDEKIAKELKLTEEEMSFIKEVTK